MAREIIKVHGETSGTWTPNLSPDANLTGAAVVNGDVSWRRIGNSVFVTIDKISGFTTTAANVDTRIGINLTGSGLPGFTAGAMVRGTAWTRRNTTGTRAVTASIINPGSGLGLTIQWIPVEASGQLIWGVSFQYDIIG